MIHSNDRAFSIGAPERTNDAAPRPLRILIADDERDGVLTLMMLLRQEGHEVRGAYSGAQAVAVFKQFEPEAVVLDIALSDISGWEIAREIRDRAANRAPLLIGISGRYTRPSDKILSQMVGFDYYFVKPYDSRALIALLEPLRQPPDTR